MTITLNALQKQRRDTASNWTSNNPTLLDGELGYETDTKKFKIGDGSTAWQSLDYLPIPDTNRLLAGNLTVGGNFTVNGTTTTIDTTTLTVEDKNIEIGKVSTPTDTTADGGGITLKAASDKTITWSNANDSWDFNQNINAASTYAYKINNVSVLNATTLGSSVVNSSLTSVGTIATGVWNATAIARSKLANVDLVDDTSPQLGGNLDVNTKNIVFGDSSDGSSDDVLTFGAGTDLKIYSDGSNGYITHTDSGGDPLYISSQNDIRLRVANTAEGIKIKSNGAVELYHSGTKKFETWSGGCQVHGSLHTDELVLQDNEKAKFGTGNDLQIYHNSNENIIGVNTVGQDIFFKSSSSSALDTTSFVVRTDGSVTHPDNIQMKFGGSDDLKIYHDGNSSWIKNAAGDLIVNSPNFYINNAAQTETMISAIQDGAVSLYHGMSGSAAEKKFETTSTGATITPDLILNNASGDTALRWADGGTNKFSLYQSSGTLRFYDNTNNTERMRIDSSGRIGIGTTSPRRQFHLHESASATVGFQMTNGNTGESNDSQGFQLKIGSDSHAEIAQMENSHLDFFTNASERMRIDSSGNVGIGTTSPSAKFHASRSTDNAIACQITNSGTTGGHGLKVVSGGTGAGTHIFNCFRDNNEEVFRLDGFGVITSRRFIGNSNGGDYYELRQSAGGSTTDATLRFFASSTSSRVFCAFHSRGNAVGSISSTTSATSYATSSDYRLKENVVSISDGITRLKTLKPYRFNFKVDPDKTVDGFFAHEVTAVPEAITGTKDEVDSDNNPVYQGIDQSKLVPLLTAALQEAITKIETLETKVAALEAA